MTHSINHPLPSLLQRFDLNNDKTLSADEIAQIHSLPESELTSFQEDLAYLIVLEILAASKNARENLVPAQDVSFDEFRILGTIQAAKNAHGKETVFPGITQQRLATELGLSTSTISSLLDKLDAARKERDSNVRPWITRTENPENRREKLVLLSHEGSINFRKARKGYKAQLRKAFLSLLSIEQLIDVRSALFSFNLALNPKHDSSRDEQNDTEETTESS